MAQCVAAVNTQLLARGAALLGRECGTDKAAIAWESNTDATEAGMKASKLTEPGMSWAVLGAGSVAVRPRAKGRSAVTLTEAGVLAPVLTEAGLSLAVSGAARR